LRGERAAPIPIRHRARPPNPQQGRFQSPHSRGECGSAKMIYTMHTLAISSNAGPPAWLRSNKKTHPQLFVTAAAATPNENWKT